MSRFALGSTFKLRDRKFYGLRGFEGKPLHPPFTDIPVGAYFIAPVLDVIGFFGRDQSWGHDMFVAAGYTMLLGAIGSLFAVLTGFADWLKMRPGSEVRRITNSHFLAMVITNVLVLTYLLHRFQMDEEVVTAGLMVHSLAVLVVMTFGAAIGGSLVFDKGYRVRMRQADDETAAPGETAFPSP
jgi:uncharacterized membrane protein